MTDPFKARVKGARADESVPTAPASSPSTSQELTRAQLEDMRKPDLVELARARGLDDTGTRADLIERLSA